MSVQTHASAPATTSQPLAPPEDQTAAVADGGAFGVGGATPLWQRLAAAIGLILLSPLAFVIALAIKATSKGPVLYAGQRVGRGGRTFMLYKFRTLEIGAEQKIGARLLEHSDGLYTRVGRMLKRAKCDEIPQLWNVIRGEMNLVGPRPVRPIFLETFTSEIPGYRERFAVNPGMTGLAQVRGGYFTHPRDKLRYDRIYIRNQWWLLDVRLVTLTFVKVLNRWLTLGVLLGLLFFSSALAPGLFHFPFEIDLGSFGLSPFEVLVALTAAWITAQRAPRHQLCLYETPINKPIAAFIAFALAASVFSPEPLLAVQGVLYYVGTGFCLTLLIIMTRLSRTEANLVATVIGLSAVTLSMIGLLQIGLDRQLGEAAAARMSSTLGSPVLLATYLVLGIPFLLTQLLHSASREQRDFWVGCSTIALVGVFLTHTRMGLAALLVTVGVFLWKTRYRFVGIVTLAAVILFGAVAAGDGMRLSVPSVTAAAVRRGAAVHDVFSAPPAQLLVGVGSTRRIALPPADDPDESWISHNMHLTLIRQHGLLGWGLMLWIVAATLVALYRGYDRIREPHMKRIVWAIFSSIVGLLLSMADFNVFFNVTIQIFFWGMVGVGIGIITHLSGRRPAFHVLWRFGEHGD